MVEYRAGNGYRRVPRTVLMTSVVLLASVVVSVWAMRGRERRAGYLGMAARCFALSAQYAERKRAELEEVAFIQDGILSIEKSLKDLGSGGAAEDRETLVKMACDQRQKAARAQQRAERSNAIASYYQLMGARYETGADRPWTVIEPPGGDPLDVELVFLSGDVP